jgi:hypothetical protein
LVGVCICVLLMLAMKGAVVVVVDLLWLVVDERYRGPLYICGDAELNIDVPL